MVIRSRLVQQPFLPTLGRLDGGTPPSRMMPGPCIMPARTASTVARMPLQVCGWRVSVGECCVMLCFHPQHKYTLEGKAGQRKLAGPGWRIQGEEDDGNDDGADIDDDDVDER